MPFAVRTGDPEMTELAKEEISDLSARLAKTQTKLKLLLLPKDPMDERNIMLEVRLACITLPLRLAPDS